MTDQRDNTDLDSGKLPDSLPILPLYDAALFPKMILPLVVMQSDSIQLVDEAMSKDRLIGVVVSRKSPQKGGQRIEDLYSVGTLSLILKMAKTEDNKAQLLVQGLSRFRITEFISAKPYPRARVRHLQEIESKDKETDALMANILGLFLRVVDLSPGLPKEIGAMAKSIQDPGILTDLIASTLNISVEEKQQILELVNTKERLTQVTRLVNYQLEILELGNKIQSQVKVDMDKSQREYYLRQQLKAIREELGDKDDTAVVIEEFKNKFEIQGLPEEARKEAERELDRLSRMHPSSSEYTVSTTYLDWLTSLPWNQSTEDRLDIKKAQKNSR